MKTIILMVFIILSFTSSFAQQAKLDSLLRLNNEYTKEDEKKLHILNEISFIQVNMKPTEGIITANKAILLAQRLDNQKELANSYNNKGANLAALSRCNQSDSVLQKALLINISIKNEEGLADTYLRLSSTNQNDMKRAIRLLNKSLEIFKQLNNKKGIADVYFNFGAWYRAVNYDSARIFFERSLVLYREINDEADAGMTLGFIGGTYLWSASYDKALEYLNKAVAINERIVNLGALQNDYMHFGILYNFKGIHPLELEYNLKGLRVSEKRGDEISEAGFLINIGTMYLDLKNYIEAKKYLEKGLEISLRLSYKSYSFNAYLSLGLI